MVQKTKFNGYIQINTMSWATIHNKIHLKITWRLPLYVQNIRSNYIPTQWLIWIETQLNEMNKKYKEKMFTSIDRLRHYLPRRYLDLVIEHDSFQFKKNSLLKNDNNLVLYFIFFSSFFILCFFSCVFNLSLYFSLVEGTASVMPV